VRRDCQVLICPRCQSSDDWMADLARCPRCGSVHLVRRLGEAECRDCGAIVPPSAGPGEGEPLAGVGDVLVGGALAGESLGGEALAGESLAGESLAGEVALTEVASGPSPDLSEEVARALDRVLGRGLVSQSAPRTGADSR
jgi:ribosomal protein L40E